jgi:hypothetical protein
MKPSRVKALFVLGAHSCLLFWVLVFSHQPFGQVVSFSQRLFFGQHYFLNSRNVHLPQFMWISSTKHTATTVFCIQL